MMKPTELGDTIFDWFWLIFKLLAYLLILVAATFSVVSYIMTRYIEVFVK